MQTSPPSRGRANSDGRRGSAHLSSPHLAMRSPLPRGGSSPNFGALETLAVPLLPPAYATPELSPMLVWSYAVGHHYNDLCAACWFTYLLVYLEGPSIGLSETLAGAVLLAGQLADGLATPIVGTGYGIIQAPVQPGVHTVVGSQAFGLTAYGYDCDVSYAYPGGLKLQAPQ